MIVSVFKTKIVCCVHKSNIAKEGKKKKQKKKRQRIIMHSPDRSALVVIATWNNPLDRVEFLNLGRLELSHTHRILFSWNLKFNHNSISRGFCLLWFFFHQKAEIEEHPLASSTCYPLQAKQLWTSLSFSKYIYSISYIFLHYNCFVLLLFLVEILNNILNLKLFSSKKK